MLDAISDFWKPSRKQGEDDALDTASIRPGSAVGFGFIPQSELSGKRLQVSDINTYVFDQDRTTSFVLESDDDSRISLVITNDGDDQ